MLAISNGGSSSDSFSFCAAKCEMYDLSISATSSEIKMKWPISKCYELQSQRTGQRLGEMKLKHASGCPIRWQAFRSRAQHRKAVLPNRCSSDDRINIEKFVCTWRTGDRVKQSQKEREKEREKERQRAFYCGDHLFIIPMWMAAMLQMFLTLFRGLLLTIVSANLFSVVLIWPLFSSVFDIEHVVGPRLSAVSVLFINSTTWTFTWWKWRCICTPSSSTNMWTTKQLQQ